MGDWFPLPWLPQEINDKSSTSQTSCSHYGWPTQTASSSPSGQWVTLSEQVTVRNLRRQTLCPKLVTPSLWTTPGPGAHPGKEMLLQAISKTTRIMNTQKNSEEDGFGAVWNQRCRNYKQTVYAHSPSLLMGTACSQAHLLSIRRMGSPGPILKLFSILS